jgi:hypothetical protein
MGYYCSVGTRHREASAVRARIRTVVRAAALLLTAIVLAACSARTGVVFDPKAGSMTMAQVEQRARTTSVASASDLDRTSAPAARQKVLVDLRTRGADGQRAAALLTKGFPQDTPSVPVWIGVGPVDGIRSVVAIEAYPDKTGRLQWRRLWVFDIGTGAVRLAATYH